MKKKETKEILLAMKPALQSAATRLQFFLKIQTFGTESIFIRNPKKQENQSFCYRPFLGCSAIQVSNQFSLLFVLELLFLKTSKVLITEVSHSTFRSTSACNFPFFPERLSPDKFLSFPGKPVPSHYPVKIVNMN